MENFIYFILSLLLSSMYTIFSGGNVICFVIVVGVTPLASWVLSVIFEGDKFVFGFLVSSLLLPIWLNWLSSIFLKLGEEELSIFFFCHRFWILLPVGIFIFFLVTMECRVQLYLDSKTVRPSPRRK